MTDKAAGGKDPVLSLCNVGVSYRRRAGILRWSHYWALKDISLDLYHGETLGIIGRNGAGKSTLLKLLAGIIAPDCGELYRNAKSISLLSLQVGFIPHLNGRENAILSGMLLGLRRKDIEQKMDQIISFAELQDFIDQPVKSYSVGMRARLGFSTAYHTDPDILLVDEVLGVGDLEFRRKSSVAMKEKMQSNKTAILVSHDVSMIRELCDRVVWIDRGKTRREGAVDDVLDAYRKNLSPQ